MGAVKLRMSLWAGLAALAAASSDETGEILSYQRSAEPIMRRQFLGPPGPSPVRGNRSSAILVTGQLVVAATALLFIVLLCFNNISGSRKGPRTLVKRRLQEDDEKACAVSFHKIPFDSDTVGCGDMRIRPIS